MTPAIFIQSDVSQSFYKPGQTLCGGYTFSGVTSEEIQRVEVSVLWFTEGKGDEDMGVHFFESILWKEFSSEKENRNEAEHPGGTFSVVLPMAPLSYYGKILKIRWNVRVRLFLIDGQDFNADWLFTVGEIPPIDVVLN